MALVFSSRDCYDTSMFNEKRILKLSDILGNVGLIFFASVFLDPILKGNADFKNIIAGLISAIGIWSVSIIMLK